MSDPSTEGIRNLTVELDLARRWGERAAKELHAAMLSELLDMERRVRRAERRLERTRRRVRGERARSRQASRRAERAEAQVKELRERTSRHVGSRFLKTALRRGKELVGALGWKGSGVSR